MLRDREKERYRIAVCPFFLGQLFTKFMDLKRSRMKRRIKASVTVEASFVVTMAIISVGIMLSLWIFKFQECWYTQMANECLLTGSNWGILKEDSYIHSVKSKWDSVKEENYLKPKNLTAQIDGTDDRISMTISGSTPILGMEPLKLSVEQKIGIVRPVKFIRIIQAGKEVLKDESGVSE